MDILQPYAISTAAWFGIQATPLLLSPTLIITLLSPEARKATALEEYLCRTLALTLLTLALLTLILTDSIPLTSTFTDPSPTPPAPQKSPYTTPTLLTTTLFHTLSAFYAYTHYTRTAQTCFALGTAGSGGMAAMGLWCLLFAEGSRISRRTGADKRTSGWPFRNVEAERRKEGRRRV